MLTVRLHLLLAALLLATATQAQSCDCPATFAWMVSTFEQNDAGFRLVLDRKGEAAYAEHTEAFRKRMADAKDLLACTELLNGWLQWFRKGHIGIGPTEQAMEAQQASAAQGNAHAAGTPGRVIKVNEAQLIKQWSKAKSMEPFEGIWSMRAYRVALVKDQAKPGAFAAVILTSKNPNWKPGEVKAEFGTSEGGHAGTFYMGDHSPKPIEVQLIPGSTAVLEMNGLWVREYPAMELNTEERILVRMISAEEPFLERLSEHTIYLRIPSFAFEQKALIDSVLAANDALIRNTENLIIDIRNGTGGSDASYAGLIPYLYTGPMRTVGVKLWSTELNAAGYEEYADMFGRRTEDGAWCMEVATRMRASLGTWLDMNEQPWSVDSSHTVSPLPQRVGIVCNERNGSTDEQFLLEARTSAKVKLFGRPTFGVLDVSNMRRVTSPDGCFQLGYTMSLSHRLPRMPVDVMGIQPDHYLDDGIPVSGWVGHVQRVLEGR
jgi:hypothetical protein